MLLATLVSIYAGTAFASEVQTDGKISVPQTAPVFAVCTDPMVQQTLEQDFRDAHREPGNGNGRPVTVTVTVNEKLLKPGVVLGDLGPGDPWVIAKLMRAAGTDPPPIGDTGNKPLDPYSEAARRGIMDPNDPMVGLRNYQSFRNEAMRPSEPRFGPNGNASDEELSRSGGSRARHRWRFTRSADGVGGSSSSRRRPHRQRAGGRGNRQLNPALRCSLSYRDEIQASPFSLA